MARSSRPEYPTIREDDHRIRRRVFSHSLNRGDLERRSLNKSWRAAAENQERWRAAAVGLSMHHLLLFLVLAIAEQRRRELLRLLVVQEGCR